MKTITLVVERVIEERYTLTLDANLGSKNLLIALKDKAEMQRYLKFSKEMSMRVIDKKEVPALCRKRKK